MGPRCRIQKYLSQKNILSRREAERAITAGLIQVNGKVVTDLATQIDPDIDKVSWDPSIDQDRKTRTTIAFYKPRGVVTNCPQGDEKEIVDLLPKPLKSLSAIGRLDKDSEGLILLTDDGLLTKHYLDPKNPHPRDYLVWTTIPLSEEDIETLEKGIWIKGGYTQETEITQLKGCCFKIRLYEGKNRQIRRMVESTGAFVTRLKRIRFGDITLGKLKPGEYRSLNLSRS